jgi:hypothetical protein
MSRGLGNVERECLRVIGEFRANGRWPNTYNITAEVFHVARDAADNRWVSNAQHASVKRALIGLRRKELVRAVMVCSCHYDPRVLHYDVATQPLPTSTAA